jgi:riboflavin kinase/FMN adenylyltransferase
MISSSRIRELLAEGRLCEAICQLGHPLRVQGTVTTGAQRGRTLGFPTANLTQLEGLLPAHGVYAGRSEVGGRRVAVAVSIGPNPTFGEQQHKVECHLIDFSGDLYGRELAVDLVAEIRPLRSFGSVDDLRRQIAADVESVVRCVDLS